ncbi:hypothetical protein BRC2024_KCUCJSVR_CDS_0034 [Acinetobacter phage vB_AbaM_KissB]
MSKQQCIFFDAFFNFKKKRNVEEYTLTINVWYTLKNRVRRGKYCIVLHGDNPRRMSIDGINKFKDFVDSSEITKGIAMSSVSYDVTKYRGHLVASHVKAQNLIVNEKGN